MFYRSEGRTHVASANARVCHVGDRAIAGLQTPEEVGVVGLRAYSGQGAWISVEAQPGRLDAMLSMHLVHRNSFYCQVSITAQYTIIPHTARPPHE